MKSEGVPMKTMQDVLHQRASVRNYDATKSIPTNDMEMILKAIQQSPTYIGGQQYSVIVIDDPEKKAQMIEFTMPRSGEPQQYIQECSHFLLFVVDFNKIYQISEYEKIPLEITQYLEGLLIGSVDVGIGIEAATVCAESLGYGTVVIGSIRKSAKAIIEAYNLPKYTFPLLGLCIGYKTEEPTPKPRLAMESFVHYNTYALNNFQQSVEEYNKTMHTYYDEEENPDDSWSRFVATFYSKGYWKELSSVYKEQGFNLE